MIPGTVFCISVFLLSINNNVFIPSLSVSTSPDPIVNYKGDILSNANIFNPLYRLLGFNTNYGSPSERESNSSPSAFTTALLPDIGVGKNPVSLATGNDAKLIYVANRGDDTVSVVDTTGNSVVSTNPLKIKSIVLIRLMTLLMVL